MKANNIPNVYISKSFGSWSAKEPETMNLEPAMQQMFSNLGATTLYRVVSVLQAPFVMKDENGKQCCKYNIF